MVAKRLITNLSWTGKEHAFSLSNHIAPEEEKSLEVEEFSFRSTDQDGRQKEEAARKVDERKTVIKRCSSFACNHSVIPLYWNYV